MSFCTSCGVRFDTASSFCTSCGEPRADAPDLARVTRTPPSGPWGAAPLAALHPSGGAPALEEPFWLTDDGPDPHRGSRGRVADAAVALALVAAAALGGGYLLLRADDAPARTAPQADAPPADLSAQPDPVDAQPTPSSTSAAATTPLPVQPESVTASCTAPDGVDAAGTRTTFRPANLLDGDPATAWRCPSDTAGQRLRFRFAEPVVLRRVALVPGYAKTDPATGEDRFTQNHPVTRARWSYGGEIRVQEIADPSRTGQALALEPAEPVTEVELVVEAIGPAPRPYVAISDVSFRGTS